jgi:hypothetical protein
MKGEKEKHGREREEEREEIRLRLSATVRVALLEPNTCKEAGGDLRHVNDAPASLLSCRWSYGDAPNGGILTSMAITAARRLSSPARPDPLSVSTYFVKKVRRGRVLGRGGGHRGKGPRELSTPFLPRLLAHSHARPSRSPQALEKTPVFLHATPLAASRSQETLQVGFHRRLFPPPLG